jgi:hypothetical protein
MTLTYVELPHRGTTRCTSRGVSFYTDTFSLRQR